MANDKYLTPAQISEIYGIERATVYWWIRERKFPRHKFERKVLIRESDFLNFLERHREPGGAEIES